MTEQEKAEIRRLRKEAYQAAWTVDELQEAIMENWDGRPQKLVRINQLRKEIREQFPLEE